MIVAIHTCFATLLLNACSTGAAGPEAIEAFVRELEAALHDGARFSEIFNRLDKELNATAAKKVALAFAKGKAKSKGEALDLIWGRHASLVGTAARARATGGRTAA